MKIYLSNLKQHNYPTLKSNACRKILNYKLHTDQPEKELEYLVQYYNERYTRMSNKERFDAEAHIMNLYQAYDEISFLPIQGGILSNLNLLRELKEIWGSTRMAVECFSPIKDNCTEEAIWGLTAFFNEEMNKQTNGIFDLSDEDHEWIRDYIILLKAFYRRPYYTARWFNVSTDYVH